MDCLNGKIKFVLYILEMVDFVQKNIIFSKRKVYINSDRISNDMILSILETTKIYT